MARAKVVALHSFNDDEALMWLSDHVDGRVEMSLSDLAQQFGWPLVTLRREFPAVFSLGRPNRVQVVVRSSARRRLRVRVTHDLFDHATAQGLPIEVLVPARGTVRAEYFVEPRRRGAYALGD